MAYCHNCGQQLEDQAKFCNHCGSKKMRPITMQPSY
ncbi:MAG: zinc-ribbon domain-containing protein [Chloroflexi bacterium]|nr:zinc-ribbon domain-containing protein [Chloroflexota bacterium]